MGTLTFRAKFDLKDSSAGSRPVTPPQAFFIVSRARHIAKTSRPIASFGVYLFTVITMAQQLQTITEQYAALYSKAEAPEVTSVTLRAKPPLSSNPSGLSISIARVLSQRISAKPETPAANARGATCDLLDAHFCALDINKVRP